MPAGDRDIILIAVTGTDSSIVVITTIISLSLLHHCVGYCYPDIIVSCYQSD